MKIEHACLGLTDCEIVEFSSAEIVSTVVPNFSGDSCVECFCWNFVIVELFLLSTL